MEKPIFDLSTDGSKPPSQDGNICDNNSKSKTKANLDLKVQNSPSFLMKKQEMEKNGSKNGTAASNPASTGSKSVAVVPLRNQKEMKVTYTARGRSIDSNYIIMGCLNCV